jgi:hypothetical protein
MQIGIRLIAQNYNIETGAVVEEMIVKDEKISKAGTLKELGYLHIEQIDFLQKIQEFKISHQIKLNHLTKCPICNSKTHKMGVFKSKFHSALTDHKVSIQKVACKCGWIGRSTIEGIYGSAMHPDLLKKQALQGSKESYKKSSVALNAESTANRAINSHSQIFKTVKAIGETLEEIKTSDDYIKKVASAEILIANIDGGHIKARGNNRSFEAMIATVYRPENLKYVDKNHNILTSKTIVASAKEDKQNAIKTLFKTACKTQGMTLATDVTCLADGAENCWSIAHFIKDECKNLTFVLDWFHISMKFKNIAIPEEYKEQYSKVKWCLWHGKVNDALNRLEQLKSSIEDTSTISKLKRLAIYIENNKDGLINYSDRKRNGLVYTSNLAEGTVNTLINERQKGKQKMLWGREGAHNVLQIRASIHSKSWDSDWEKAESKIYKIAA